MDEVIGIDHMAVYVPNQYLSLTELAKARHIDEKKFLFGIGIKEMAVPSSLEDTVVLAANAGCRVLKEAQISPQEVGLLIVGTESAEDRAKPTATYVHALLGISQSCRVYDIVHACAGATYGLLSAIEWVRSPNHKYALVIATDIARYGLASAGEPTQGAGAVALVVCKDPRLLKVEELSNYSRHVYDFWKPWYSQYPIVKGVYSAQCYLEAAKACFGSIKISRHAAFIYHTPYPKLVEKAHAEIVRMFGGDTDWTHHYAEKVASSNEYPSRVGNTYTASLWLSLVSFLERSYDRAIAEGRRPNDEMAQHDGIYLFSYGSGCGAVLMRGELRDSWESMVKQFGVEHVLDKRRRLTVQEYEQLLLSPTVQSGETTAGYFKFVGVRNDERCYARVCDETYSP